MIDEQPSVLLVDDEPANLEAFRRVFRRQFRMHLCTDPNEALKTLEAESFDIIIVDHAMPEMTGVEFLEAARLLAPDSGRMIVTGYPDLPEVRDSSHAGLASAVIMKPWKKEEIVYWTLHFKQQRDEQRAAT